ncbi:MAG: SBBP repeat-containing protein [Ignavibacteria bacterium]|nr:SBBP repeat-containing protein [Ignavibacteria bacterium]
MPRLPRLLLLAALLPLLVFRGDHRGPDGIAAGQQKRSAVATSQQDQLIRRALDEIRFVENRGQYPSDVLFVARLSNGSVAFFTDRVVFRFVEEETTEPEREERNIHLAGYSSNKSRHTARHAETSVRTVTVRYPGSRLDAEVRGICEREEKVNIFRGSDPEQWKRSIATFDTLVYRNIYDGIDLFFFDGGGRLKYEFVVQPGSSYERIHIAYDGVDALTVTGDGDLSIGIGDETMVEEKPLVYQKDGNTVRQLQAQYALEAPRQLGYQIADVDPILPLVIDPLYSTLIGGSSYEAVRDIAVLSDSLVILCLAAKSNDLVGTDKSYQQHNGGQGDVFIIEINVYTSEIIFSTYFGGSQDDFAITIQADDGVLRISGGTKSANLPTTTGALQRTFRGQEDCFVAAFGPKCETLIYSTYLGGTGLDYAEDICFDAIGNAYLAGWTDSYSSFPRTSDAVQRTYSGGDDDAFVSKISNDGSKVLYSTLLGGADFDEARGISVDPDGRIVVCGYTSSGNFPVRGNALQTSRKGVEAGFISVIDSGGRVLTFSTYFGGSFNDLFEEMTATDDGGYVFLGETTSLNLPVTPGVIQSTRANKDSSIFSWDYSLLRLDSACNVKWCSYLGGSKEEEAEAICYSTEKVYVTGTSTSKDFPLKHSLLSGMAGWNTTLSAIDGSGELLLMSTLWGGNGSDYVCAVQVHRDIVYLLGATYSTDFPLTDNALKKDRSGGNDAYVTIFSFDELHLTEATEMPTASSTIILSQNYPNPFHTATEIIYETQKPEDIELRVYDIRGRIIDLQSWSRVAPGRHVYRFEKGGLAPGIYFYSLRGGGVTVTKKMVKLNPG